MHWMPFRQCGLYLLLGVAVAVHDPDGLSAAEPKARLHLLIAVTSQLRGSVSSFVLDPHRAPGGLAHLAPLVRRLRAAFPDLILVDTGGALTGAPDAPILDSPHAVPTIVGPMATLGYDAAVLGERDLGMEPEAWAAVIGRSPFPWLGANVELPQGLPTLAAHRIIERSGVRIAFVGLASPAALVGSDPARSAGVRIGDVETAALAEANQLRSAEQADLIVALGGGSSAGDQGREAAWMMDMPLPNAAGRLADNVPELDLIIASRGRAPRKGETLRPNRSYRVPLIEPAPGARRLTVVDIELARTGNRWTISEFAQETLWADAEADRELLASVRAELARTQAHLAQPTQVFLAGRPRKRVQQACAGALTHAAALRIRLDTASIPTLHAGMEPRPGISSAPLSLLPFLWNLPRLTKSDYGRRVTRGDLHRWIVQDDRLVWAALTGRQVSLLLEPYIRQAHGWKVPLAQVLFPGGLELSLQPKRSEAESLSISGSMAPLRDEDRYGVWMTHFHRFGGGGIAARALIQLEQPYRPASVALREAVMNLLSDASAGLPPACDRFLSRQPPAPRRARRRGTAALPAGPDSGGAQALRMPRGS
jgi:2',3'-cyclic-nucleotide 2'-phosphodiesterase (5'-nucleotidase family)